MQRAFRRFSLFFVLAFRKAIHHPKIVVWGTLLTVLALGSQMGRLRTLLSTDDLLDPSFRSTEELLALKRDFKIGTSSLLVIAPVPEGRAFQVSELCLIRGWWEHELLRNSGIRWSYSPFDLRQPRFEANSLAYRRLLDLDCRSGAQAQGQANTKANADPMSEVRRSRWNRILTSAKTGDLLFDFTIADGADEKGLGSFNLEALSEMRASFEREVSRNIGPNIAYHWTGPADFQYSMFEGLRQSGVLNLGIMVFLALGLRFFFGTWVAGALFVLTLMISGAILYGAMGLFGVPIDVLDNSLFLMLAVGALEDFIFLSHERARSGNWKASFRRMLIPGLLTSFTTLLGFGSLCTSSLSTISRFGLWAAVAALLEWASVFFFLPALLSIFPRLSNWALADRAGQFQWTAVLGRWGLPRRAAIACLITAGLGFLAVGHLNVTDDPALVFPEAHPFRQGIDAMVHSRGWKTTISLVFQGEEIMERKLMESVRKIPGVIISEDPESFRTGLTEGLDPLQAGLVRREMKGTRAYQRLASPAGTSRAILYVADSDLARLNLTRNRLMALCRGGELCTVTGSMIAYSDFADQVPKTLLKSLVTSVLFVSLVIVLLGLALGQTGGLHWLALSSLWGPSVMMIVIAAGQLRINFMTCIFASVLVGLTGDNAIQFLCATFKRGSRNSSISPSGRASLLDGVDLRGRASVQCSLMMALGSLVFLGSYFLPARVFGGLLSGGLLASLAGDLWILRGILREEGPEGGRIPARTLSEKSSPAEYGTRAPPS